MHRLLLPAGLCAGLALLLLALTAGTAQAGSRYRYWSYWKADHGTWTYATVGPASVPTGESVEGWRFAASAEGQAPPPRRSPSFTKLCGTGAAKAGTKRVGVVVDYGVGGDAGAGETPPGTTRGFCATVPAAANGYAVLDDGASFRADGSGLVCGVDGYPRRGCGDAAQSGPSPAARAGAESPAPRARGKGPAGSSRSPLIALAGIVAAAAVGTAAFLRSRRSPR